MENDKFSKKITDLVEVWWEWMKHDSIARNSDIDIKTRKISVDFCENLIKAEYDTINKINSYFDRKA